MSYFRLLTLMALGLCLSACSWNRFTVNQTAALMQSAGIAFDSESDLELVAAALPGNIKSLEGMLAIEPEQPILLRLLAEAYFAYAFGFIEDEAEEIANRDAPRAAVLRMRAVTYYWRAHAYALRLLALQHAAIADELRSGQLVHPEILAELALEDNPAIFWIANTWGAALHLEGASDRAVVAMPVIRALLERSVQLDERYNDAGAHIALGSLEASVPLMMGGRPDLAIQHFRRALELSDGKNAMARVMFASKFAVQMADQKLFNDQLQMVVALTSDTAATSGALQRQIARRRAIRYLAHAANRK